ncbi:hypothetical protein [Brevundimonas sp. Marseille-Q4549]|jgi:hypothetical protein
MSEAKTGFTRGFFGCFGVLAAIVFVIVGFATLSHCAAVIPANDKRDDDSGKDFNRLTYASHCANALVEAGGKGQINADRSAVVVPWSIVKVGGTDTFPILECAVTEGDRVRFVTVEVVCEDDSAERCSALKGVSDARTGR